MSIGRILLILAIIASGAAFATGARQPRSAALVSLILTLARARQRAGDMFRLADGKGAVAAASDDGKGGFPNIDGASHDVIDLRDNVNDDKCDFENEVDKPLDLVALPDRPYKGVVPAPALVDTPEDFMDWNNELVDVILDGTTEFGPLLPEEINVVCDFLALNSKGATKLGLVMPYAAPDGDQEWTRRCLYHERVAAFLEKVHQQNSLPAEAGELCQSTRLTLLAKRSLARGQAILVG